MASSNGCGRMMTQAQRLFDCCQPSFLSNEALLDQLLADTSGSLSSPVWAMPNWTASHFHVDLKTMQNTVGTVGTHHNAFLKASMHDMKVGETLDTNVLTTPREAPVWC